MAKTLPVESVLVIQQQGLLANLDLVRPFRNTVLS